ncbi:hypothetical protein PIN31115_03338 [Pandoraea iniqua]|uniref:Uncharacterized protein n=1 Tax=Pandoraea iniqua TaxID=2508288 RepID=A0A5E4WMZ2_9BURK|nr:hypothetical protein PIN31115_03338 [Pandoraea iniqua]
MRICLLPAFAAFNAFTAFSASSVLTQAIPQKNTIERDNS